MPGGLRQYSEWVALIHQLLQDVLRRDRPLLANNKSPPHSRCEGTSLTAKLPEATLDAIAVERPSPTDEAPRQLCLDKGYDPEPSRDGLLGRRYIDHIRSIGEEKDEADQRRYPVRRWVVERTLGWLSKGRAILVHYEK